MRQLWTRYTPGYIVSILYMLQSSNYQLGEYFSWYHRTNNFRHVMKRRQLDVTKKILLLGIAAGIIIITVVLLAVVFAFNNFVIISIILLAGLPWIIAYGIVAPLWIGRAIIQLPRERRIIADAHEILAAHPATKIAIAGSYGKTTAKEILLSVLIEGKKVAATPGSMNTPIGISRFAAKLDGDEDILIFELGESHVGDVRELCELVQPDIGVITGINEAHLSSFKTLERTVDTIFELHDFLGKKPVYANVESPLVRERLKNISGIQSFGHSGTSGWVVSDAKVSIHGTSFSIRKKGEIIWAQTGILGIQNIGILSVAVAIADSFGLTQSQIVEGLKNVQPFEHRMQPSRLHGAWVIDDTYNGNSEGVAAGLKLLKQLDAKRRVYITPGLVEQGEKTEEVHVKIGKQIADVADVVVLMQNSVTDYIAAGLQDKKYKGKLLVVDDPLYFYKNLDQFVAAGDVVLMQNDWTDNYA